MHPTFTRTLVVASCAALAGSLLVALPEVAQGGGARMPELRIIRGVPTTDRGDDTADDHALFDLVQPAWPGFNECSLDGGKWKTCSFFFEASGLSNGRHTLDVRQTDQNSKVTKDKWFWNVTGPQIDVEPHAYCWLGFENPSVPDSALQTQQEGRVLWRSYVPGSKEASTYPNNYTTAGPSRRGFDDPFDYSTGDRAPYPWWYATFINEILANPAIGDMVVTSGEGSKAGNVWPAGEGTPFPEVATIDTSNPDPALPAWILKEPDSQPGDFKPGLSVIGRAEVNTTYAPCLQLHPPAAVVDNGDGTMSAIFGWSNFSPWTIKAKAGPQGSGTWKAPSNGDTQAQLAGNIMTGRLDASGPLPAGAPTEFGANSQGTWTYTFPDPGSDIKNPVTWKVGYESAALYFRQDKVIPPTKKPVTPFTHATGPNGKPTTHTTPARPITVNHQNPHKQTVGNPPSPDRSGGTVTTKTTLTVKHKITKPKGHHVKRGKKIHFRAKLRNKGHVDAVNPTICDRIPKGMTFVKAPGREQFDNRWVCWTSSRLAAGAAVWGSMTLKAKPNAKLGKRKNKVRVAANNAHVVKAKTKFFVTKKRKG